MSPVLVGPSLLASVFSRCLNGLISDGRRLDIIKLRAAFTKVAKQPCRKGFDSDSNSRRATSPIRPFAHFNRTEDVFFEANRASTTSGIPSKLDSQFVPFLRHCQSNAPRQPL